MQQAQGDAAADRLDFWSRHLAWRQPVEGVLWVLVFVLAAVANTAVALVDAERAGHVLEAWKPATWEATSAVASLMLLPVLLWLCERWPLHADTWRRRLPGYLAASVLWSVLHVTGMVLMRMLVHAAMGDRYDFDWATGLPYEYLKDVRTFASIVFVAHAYRWLWRRIQGEAQVLTSHGSDIPVAPPGRPERFLVRKLGREFLVAARDIEWLQAAGNYVNLHVAGRDYPLRSTMAGIEVQLDPARFARIHRSYIVNLDRIASIEPMDSGDARVHLVDGGQLPCSRSFREELRERSLSRALPQDEKPRPADGNRRRGVAS